MADKTGRTARAGVTAPLRHRDFRLLMGAFAISCAGSWAYNVALAVLVFEQTDSLAWVGAGTVAVAAGVAAYFILGDSPQTTQLDTEFGK